TYPAPYYWAGFVLAGDVGSLGPPDTRFPISVAAGIWLVLAMLAGLLGFMLWRVLRRRSGGDNPAPE
ncbi:MAG TPA: hypothetical protein VLA19_18865, partial [Herpetosiphonaceae bacterium]|nr:hypothetical protein [Herpetosiphonaceae bacterium]